MPRLKLCILFALACLLIACDPLAPDAPRKVIVVTQTTAPTLFPTVALTITQTPLPTSTIQPTEIATEAAISVPEATAFVCNTSKGQILDLSFISKIAGTVNYRAYLPPCYYESTRRYPYVILMPGSDQNQTEWTDLLKVHEALDAGIALKALPPMILIMTDGGDVMNTNVFTENASWESVIVKELMPEIEKSFCTWNAREGRAIGGISRGGFWAYEITFRFPDLFGAVGGHSAYFDLQNAPADYNPLSLAKTVEFAPGTQPRFWLDVGKDDDTRPNIEILQKTLAGRSIDSGYTMNSTGDHTIDYWAAHVTDYLSFYGQTWPRDVMELPSCLQ
ncbi:MAG: alpha/beta hydrolase-fold protein [Chloroflexota bacterium]